MTEISPVDPGASASLEAKWKYAQAIAVSDLIPREYRGKPANVLVMMGWAESLGLNLFYVMQELRFIDGRPSASAAFIKTLAHRAGHILRVQMENGSAVATLVRKDDPDFVFRSEWNLDRAVRAGLCHIKDGRAFARSKTGYPTPWELYTDAMLKARAVTEVARDGASDSLGGVAYTPEELENSAAFTPAKPEVAPEPANEAPAGRSPSEAVESVTIESEAAEPKVEKSPTSGGLASAAQLKAIASALAACGVLGKPALRESVGKILGLADLDSSKLTKAQASQVLEILKPLADSENPEAALAEFFAA